MNPALQIATMSAAEVDFAIDLAAAEGWNPGRHDAAAFHAADPGGFLVGRIDGQPIGCIAAVSYGGGFGFIGLYIVVPAWRGKGCGIALWRAGMARLAGHAVGLDGVLAQQDNYRRSGFRMAYSNLRLERTGPLPAADMRGIVSVDDVPFAQVHDYDRQVFAADRAPFLRTWIAQPDHTALAHVADGGIDGYGVIRRCRRGSKIGPLFAANADVAERLYLALCRHAGDTDPVYVDVPEVNAPALRLADKYAMKKVFGTARMYAGEPPRIPLAQVFGVTTFELG
jgi:hypothetical protein